MTAKHAWKVELIPLDHNSEEQATRLYDQRVACGWRAEEVPSWVESAKNGGKIFYWVNLVDAVQDRDTLIDTHIKAYPKESFSLRDSACEVRLVPREPTQKEFIPIGHVALDIHPAEDDAKLKLPSEGIVWIHQLYVSYALQGGGFGAGAMDQVETVAAQEPMKARMMVLDTIAEDIQLSPLGRKGLYEDRGIPVPVVSTEEWYTRRGYEIFRRERGAYTWNYGTGKMVLDIVYMKKMVG
ncbi:hypothetical protein BJ170DRAFT_238180 [Xylariales sp. AK1849]|nr:hypothetical protein BJ170DRAFT_238180 [Xylariales sp. AK1849]